MDSNISKSTIEIGRILRRLRKKKNITLKQLDDKTKLSTTYLSQLERGLRNPTIGVLERYCSAINIEIEEVFSSFVRNINFKEHIDFEVKEDEIRFLESYRKLIQSEKDALLVIVNRLTKS